MSTRKNIFYGLALVAALLASGPLSAADKPAGKPAGKPADKPAVHSPVRITSTFLVPASVKEGRDPFFPESIRVFTLNAPSTTEKPKDLTSLRVLGISGPPGNQLVIINNHTFAVGDDGDVLTTAGRVHLRVMEIQPGAVIVEVDGQTHKINLEDR